MQVTFFSFIMSVLWFNLYIIIINILRKNDKFIISFSTLPLVWFLFLSIFRLIFNFEIPGSKVIRSKTVFTKVFDFMRMPLRLNNFNVTIFQVLIIIWILGIFIMLVKTMKKYRIFKNILRDLEKQQTNKTEEILNRILIQNKMNTKIEIIQNENITSPFISGIIKGKIYIPNIDFSEEELEYIILHEINHFLRKDSFKKLLIQSIKHLLWWNPFAHIFANNFNQILEIQCDLKTTANFTEKEKLRYLESITKIIKKNIYSSNENFDYTAASNFVELNEVDSLKQRFRIVLNYKHNRRLFSAFNITLCFLIFFLFISSYFIIIQPHYNQTISNTYIKENIDNSFIIKKSTDSYDIYINNIFKYNIKNLEDLNKNLRDLPIYEEGSK